MRVGPLLPVERDRVSALGRDRLSRGGRFELFRVGTFVDDDTFLGPAVGASKFRVGLIFQVP
jgi:hypothetical protein